MSESNNIFDLWANWWSAMWGQPVVEVKTTKVTVKPVRKKPVSKKAVKIGETVYVEEKQATAVEKKKPVVRKPKKK